MKRILLLVILIIVLVVPYSFAQKKNTIKVSISIKERVFLRHYSDTELGYIFKTITDSTVSLLNRYLPFFTFSASTESNNELILSLNKRTSSLDTVYFFWDAEIRVLNPPKDIENLTWKYGDESNYDRGISTIPHDWVMALYDHFKERLSDDFNQTQMLSILQYVKVAENVDQQDLNRKLWTLSQTYDKLNIGIDSKFRVEHKLIENDQPVIDKITCQVNAIPHDGIKILLKAIQPTLKYPVNEYQNLEGIYLIGYEPWKRTR